MKLKFATIQAAALMLIIIGTCRGQDRSPEAPGVLSCSPAPCVLPPTQASEGGDPVNTSPIVADPVNPARLLLGSYDLNCYYGLGFFTTTDGGSNWSRTCTDQPIGLDQPASNPMVGYDRNGVAYIASVYIRGGYGTGLIGIQHSTDGVNWSQPVTALREGMFPFSPWLVVDTNIGSPFLDNLYVSAVVITAVSGQIYVSRSSDGGNTWRAVPVYAAEFPPKYDWYTNLTVGKNGTLYLSWVYCVSVGSGPCGSQERAQMVFTRSLDGGNTWSKPALITTINIGPDMLPNTTIGMPFYSALGVDNSAGPYAGSLYAVMWTWTGTYMRVQVSRSTDDGRTWSKPVPVAPPSDTHDQFFPWLSVSPTGLVGVSWLDRRNDPANIEYQAFAAISTDGGKSFQPNIQLTQKFSNPDNNGYNGMGDYTGNTWDGPKYFVAAWMDSSNGVNMQDVVGGIRLK